MDFTFLEYGCFIPLLKNINKNHPSCIFISFLKAATSYYIIKGRKGTLRFHFPKTPRQSVRVKKKIWKEKHSNKNAFLFFKNFYTFSFILCIFDSVGIMRTI